MAFQIRCNVLSGKDRPLPFYCSSIETFDKPDSILERFLLDAKKHAVYGNHWEVEVLDDDDDSDEEEELEHTVQVYVERFDGV